MSKRVVSKDKVPCEDQDEHSCVKYMSSLESLEEFKVDLGENQRNPLSKIKLNQMSSKTWIRAADPTLDRKSKERDSSDEVKIDRFSPKSV